MDFDPYHQWLGIPAYEQPPHHYRLLGVALFENHADVIESGADRQRAHLRSYLAGPNRVLAERLLEEVAAAKICLLNPARRAAYDVELRRRLAATGLVQAIATPVVALPSTMASAPLPVSAPIPPPPVDDAAAAVPAVVSGRLAQQRRQGQRALLLASLVAGVLLVVAAAMWKSGGFGRAGGPAVETPRTIVEKPADEASPPPPSSNDPPATPPAVPPGKSTEGPTTPRVVATNPPPTPAAPDPIGIQPADRTPPTEPPASPAEPGAPKRRPVPAAEEQAKIRAVAEGTYQLRKERSAAEKLPVVQDLIAVADQSSGSPAERFVLLRLAAELAAEAGDAPRMLQAVDALAVDFELDALRTKAALLKRFAETAVDPTRLAALVEASRALCAEAIREDRFDEALSVATLVSQACQRPAAKAFKKEVVERLQRITQMQGRYQTVAAARAVLAQSPDNAEANLIVGQWFCYSRGQWNKGLPYLAKGADAELAALAKTELESPPPQLDGQVALADAWYDLGQARGGEARDRLLSRAGTWYERAKTASPSGRVLMRIEKRLTEVAKIGPPPVELLLAGGDTPVAERVAPGGWVDLMPRIDTARDAVQGDWKHQGETLAVSSGDFARLMLPLQMGRAEYDIEIEFSRSEGTEALGLVLPLGGTQVAFVLSAAGGTVGGLELFDGKRVGDGKNPTRRPGGIQKDRRSTVLVAVRHEDKMIAIAAVLNGKPYTRGVGDQGKLLLPPDWALPDFDRPALAVHQSDVTFRRVRVRVLSGTATFVTRTK